MTLLPWKPCKIPTVAARHLYLNGSRFEMHSSGSFKEWVHDVQVFWFRHMFLLSAEDAAAVQQLIVQLLGDKKLEVQELAARTLSGLIQVGLSLSSLLYAALILISPVNAACHLSAIQSWHLCKYNACIHGLDTHSLARQSHAIVLLGIHPKDYRPVMSEQAACDQNAPKVCLPCTSCSEIHVTSEVISTQESYTEHQEECCWRAGSVAG